MRWLILSLSLTACTPASAAPPVMGVGKAKDGDSLMVGSTEVRLFGVDAPEFDQTCKRDGQAWACGQAAGDKLRSLVTGKQVSCTSMGTDQHERVLGRCTVGTTDINRVMVATGYAVAYRHYSSDYVSAEQSAKLNRRGLWAGTFEMPSDYRHSDEATVQRRSERPQRAFSSRPTVSSIRSSPQPYGSCRIKGNQGSNGWIYHLPGMPYYEKTKAEQIFCTEAEAQAAGYRRAIVR